MMPPADIPELDIQDEVPQAPPASIAPTIAPPKAKPARVGAPVAAPPVGPSIAPPRAKPVRVGPDVTLGALMGMALGGVPAVAAGRDAAAGAPAAAAPDLADAAVGLSAVASVAASLGKTQAVTADAKGGLSIGDVSVANQVANSVSPNALSAADVGAMAAVGYEVAYGGYGYSTPQGATYASFGDMMSALGVALGLTEPRAVADPDTAAAEAAEAAAANAAAAETSVSAAAVAGLAEAVASVGVAASLAEMAAAHGRAGTAASVASVANEMAAAGATPGAIANAIESVAPGVFTETQKTAIATTAVNDSGTASSGGGGKPILLDMDADGLEWSDVDDANVLFDMNGDGWMEKAAWVAGDDAMLVIDLDGDGTASSYEEIAMVAHHADATTDLEGLRLAFDSNNDGVFDKLDERWGAFGVIRDLNGDGVVEAHEFQTLDEAGIESIALTSDGVRRVFGDIVSHGEAIATLTDGSTIAAHDAAIGYSDIGGYRYDDQGDLEVAYDGDKVAFASFTGQARSVDLTANGYSAAIGGDGDDTFFNTDGTHVLLDGVGGDDTLTGGAGGDMIAGGAGADALFGGAGDDTLYVDADDVAVEGGAGQDTVYVMNDSAGVDLDIAAGEIEVALGGYGDDRFDASGAAFGVTLDGREGDDVLTGGDAADDLTGGIGADQLYGGAGDDVLRIDGDDTAIDAGAGFDTLIVADAGGVAVDVGAAQAEVALGDSGDDLLDATSATESVTLFGGAGDDTLIGGAGEDTLIGGDGFDVVSFAHLTEGLTIDLGALADEDGVLVVAGDTLVGIEAVIGSDYGDTLIGGDADERLEGGVGTDAIFGGAGRDAVAYTQAAAGVTVDLAAGTASDGDVISGVEDIIGSDHDDVLRGDDGDNTLEGGLGADALYGGGGSDIVSYANAATGVMVDLSGAEDATGAAAGDQFSSIEGLIGSDHDDTLFGDDGVNTLSGGGGHRPARRRTRRRRLSLLARR